MHLPQAQVNANPSLPRGTEPAAPVRSDDTDADWLAFLALGLRVDTLPPLAGSGWRRAPVLLSY